MNKGSKIKVLIADHIENVSLIREALANLENIEVFTAEDGQECFKQIIQVQPDIVFLELKMPKIHGINILQTIRNIPGLQGMAVVICTVSALNQDYSAAIDSGADYYLVKPFEKKEIHKIIEKFRAKELKPEPFHLPSYAHFGLAQNYSPKVCCSGGYIRFWGTRGSIPVSGVMYQRNGGHTSCLEVHSKGHTLIIDAGTGIQNLGKELMQGSARHISLVIGHTHWDHIIGFPFFDPAYCKDFTIDIYAAKGFNKNLKELFSGMLDYDYFPIRLEELQANLRFHELDGSPIKVGDLSVHYTYANHPGATLCFRIDGLERKVGYATDNELFVGYHGDPKEIHEDHELLKNYRGLLDFYKGCEVIVHEAQYTPDEYKSKVGWGHSSISNAAIFIKYCKPKEWVFTHHDPTHTDDMLREKLLLHKTILRDCGIDTYSVRAYEGLRISV